MKKSFSFFTGFLTVLGMSFSPFFAKATAPTAITSGTLIKASSPTVYYFGENLKRYVFPDEKTYQSWYTDFSDIKTLADAELATMPIAGNVTIRPGTKLAKITTDPKVYAVSRGGALRWITDEGVAKALYGTDWAKKVVDIPDAFFVNYTIGLPIYHATDFLPELETLLTPSINLDKSLLPNLTGELPQQTTPITQTLIAPTSSTAATSTSQTTKTVAISASDTGPRAGQVITLFSTANPTSGISHVSLFFDNILQRTCESAPCGSDVIIPLSGTKPTYEVKAIVKWLTGESKEATQTLTTGSASNLITLSATHNEVRPNAIQELIAGVNHAFAVKYLDIFVDGGNIKGCVSVQQCRFSGAEAGTLGSTRSAYAVAQDMNGIKIQSPTITYQVVANDHPQISFTMGKTSLYKGEQSDIALQATDDDGIAWIELWVDNTLIKRCLSSVCSSNIGPWSMSRSVQVTGKAKDNTGLLGSATSSAITVQ